VTIIKLNKNNIAKLPALIALKISIIVKNFHFYKIKILTLVLKILR